MFSSHKNTDTEILAKRYGILAPRKPLVEQVKRDPLSRVRSHFVFKRRRDKDGKTQIVVLQQETYGAVIYQRNPLSDEVEIDHRSGAREAIRHGNFVYFDELAQAQAQAQEGTAGVVSSSSNIIS